MIQILRSQISARAAFSAILYQVSGPVAHAFVLVHAKRRR